MRYYISTFLAYQFITTHCPPSTYSITFILHLPHHLSTAPVDHLALLLVGHLALQYYRLLLLAHHHITHKILPQPMCGSTLVSHFPHLPPATSLSHSSQPTISPVSSISLFSQISSPFLHNVIPATLLPFPLPSRKTAGSPRPSHHYPLAQRFADSRAIGSVRWSNSPPGYFPLTVGAGSSQL